jgi:hypothetical protein
VFKVPNVRPAFYYLIGYGIPAVITAITAASTSGTAYATDH